MLANMAKTTAEIDSNFEIFVDIKNAIRQPESHLRKRISNYKFLFSLFDKPISNNYLVNQYFSDLK